MAEVFYGKTEEHTLTNLKRYSGHLKVGEELINVGGVNLDGVGIYDNIVQIYQTSCTI